MPLARRGVADVLVLGRYNYTNAQPGLPDHAHRAIEICYLVKGRQTYRIGGEDFRLNGGDVFITFPNEKHSTGESIQEKGVLYWMVLRVPPRRAGFVGLNKAQGDALLEGLSEVRSRHFRGSLKMQEHLDAITTIYHEPPSPLQSFALVNRVGAFLLEVIGCARSVPRRVNARPLLPVLEYIGQNLGEPLPIPLLAEQAGLSVPRLKARFKQEIGMPPGEYVLRAKVAEAQRRLVGGKASVTQVAFDLGFSTSQYFATVFKRFTRQTPSAWKG
jgi:AraC-like DNA-binding protein